jgi:hypothetical protein
MEILKPSIADFTNSAHDHSNATGAGALADNLISYAKQGTEFKGDLTITANAIDWSTGFYKAVTLSANTTYTFTNLEKGKTLVLRITGSYVLAFNASCGCELVNNGVYDGTKYNYILLTCVDSTTAKVLMSINKTA